MLNSYEAIIENGQIQCLTDASKVYKARVIVTKKEKDTSLQIYLWKNYKYRAYRLQRTAPQD